MNILIYIFAGLGILITLFVIYILIVKPIITYLRRFYTFYILKKINVGQINSVAEFFLGPSHIDKMTRDEYKKKYGYEAKFKDCY